ncbi:hypothetical protein [Paeniglutamicibacter terrestris]|uniref:Uncharacterized protein n=1 Tax=Paeniglutamicibacter terrestris TaxID=2723403 RepID=A0ABX1G9J0_9MICC|nr:hypothetical protein [Paeniglutamicibacter terrestris]NKG22205.1 hypothetical protein [Paeniglutamicibacter terrestris]
MAISIKRAERRVTLCLDGELFAKYEDADARLKEAMRKQSVDGRLNGPVAAIQKEVHALFEAQRNASVTFVVRALPRVDWDALVAAHKPREKNELDADAGFNIATIFDAAMSHEKPTAIVRVTDSEGVAQDFKPSDWQALSDEMSRSQYVEFQNAVNTLNRGDNEIPFSHAAFKTSQGSAGKSK